MALAILTTMCHFGLVDIQRNLQPGSFVKPAELKAHGPGRDRYRIVAGSLGCACDLLGAPDDGSFIRFVDSLLEQDIIDRVRVLWWRESGRVDFDAAAARSPVEPITAGEFRRHGSALPPDVWYELDCSTVHGAR